MNKAILSIIILGILSQLYANIYATTNTNKRVILKDNGSWVYLKNDKKQTINSSVYKDKTLK
jgi:hypothetical protein